MARSGDVIIKVNTADILKLEKDGETILFNQEAEEAIAKLLEMKRELDGALDYLASSIERQALEYNPNFTGLKGDLIKINYSASGAKYKDLGTVRRRCEKFWTKKVSWQLNSKAVDEFVARRGNLPKGIVEIHRKKSIRISEVNHD